ncbi:hypothetical protein ONZ45_g1390 [Pleurotus djamor]|nr:hypothetical protein ONZ45_g1390 [Pleurotus djamor]
MKFFGLSSVMMSLLVILCLSVSMVTPAPFPDTSLTTLGARALDERSLGSDAAMETIVTSVVEGIVGGIQQDNERREAYTKGVVAEMRNKFPNFNWVICHVKHSTNFEGTRGVDWGHKHHEFDIVIGGTIGYELYWFRKGEFTRHGDGGFINWAYRGNVVSRSGDGKHITFSAP